MAAYLLCLTAEGGVPLFYRTRSDLKPLPFPVLGSLNGVHMFCRSHLVQLQSTTTADSKIVWKDYHNSLSLVVVSYDDDSSDQHLTGLLDLVFHAIVLVYGFEDTTNIKNVERFKREIRVCYKLLDRLLGHTVSVTSGDVCAAVDVTPGPEIPTLQSYIDAFTDAADSPYGCLMLHGKVAVATSKWWELSPTELVLLSMLVSSLPVSTSRDVAVFLPHSSPTVPHRLLTFQLLPWVEVCVICGPTPSLTELETEVDRFWSPSVDSLRSLLQIHPRNLPHHIVLDSNIIGLLLVNTSTHVSLSTMTPHTDDVTRRHGHSGPRLTLGERRTILHTYYRTVTGQVWSTPYTNDNTGGEMCEPLTHAVTDTYTCTERYKCYATRNGEYELYTLYSQHIPTYSMRTVSQKTLQILTKDKHINV